jgi:hypothetical protein
MTSDTRAKVHRSVGNPLTRGPRLSSVTTSASWLSDKRGRRPARPAPTRASRPPLDHNRCHCDAACGDTPRVWATSAWLLPRRNMSAARRRRFLSASKSRRERTGLVPPLCFGALREPDTQSVCHNNVVTSMYYRKIFRAAGTSQSAHRPRAFGRRSTRKSQRGRRRRRRGWAGPSAATAAALGRTSTSGRPGQRR